MTSLLARGVGIAGRLVPTDLEVGGGELVALVGPNGGGKTSLLRALARIEGAGGSVRVDGEDVDMAPAARRRSLLSFLPASRDLGWEISARDLISLGLERPDQERVDALLSMMELEQLADRPANQLSTGERARVLAARALVSRPRLLLLDEPLSNLDPYWVLRFVELLRGCADAGQVVLAALHDLAQLRHFDRALLIAGGRVQMDEAPADLIASERFSRLFRVAATDEGWTIRREDRRSSP